MVVLKYDQENSKVSLGYKQLKDDPWNEVDSKFTPGERIKGKVVNLTDYGVFVEIGSVPNSEFVKDLVELNKSGEILIDHKTAATS
ncbi:MAG: 30S ribosomal protein S1, partial [Candidatus Saccharibacteria bacterium GW2011_GWC2_48_9]